MGGMIPFNKLPLVNIGIYLPENTEMVFRYLSLLSARNASFKAVSTGIFKTTADFFI